MSKSKARVFVPLTKVDEEQRLVYGTITQQVLDKSGEMMDYTKSKPNFEKWSNDIHTASGGLSKGNLRVMHGLSVAGKLTELEFNDNDQSIEVCSKVVDENEWQKVLEGCYTGFSVGGKYGKRWNETIDGNVVKKYEAIPNEVSLVDNPCCPSATFSLVKADGAEEEVMFKAAADQEVSEEADEVEEPKQPDEPVVDTVAKAAPVVAPIQGNFTNEQVAAKATELAKAAGDKPWADFIEAARAELTKGTTSEAPAAEEEKEAQAEPAAEDAGEATTDEPAADAIEKITPPGVRQVWAASDGKTFSKKSEAETHEGSLTKVAVEPTEAELLAARLSKALDPESSEEQQKELPLLEDFDRMSKVVEAIITPMGEDGKPALVKGMYVVNRFSNILSDMAAVAKKIKSEAKAEGDNATEGGVSDDLMSAVKTLGAAFITYTQEQVTQLLAGMDDDVVVSVYDYYYDAVQVDPENGLAKDVCEVVNALREPAKETRETLVKAFGLIAEEDLETDELSPPMQKRFDKLEAENIELKKVAETAVASVEDFAKRLKTVEDTPMPRAPNSEAVPKDGTFLGKAANSDDEKMAVLQDLLKQHGPDGMATLMIKAAHAQGGQKLALKS